MPGVVTADGARAGHGCSLCALPSHKTHLRATAPKSAQRISQISVDIPDVALYGAEYAHIEPGGGS